MKVQPTGYWTFFCNPAKWEIDEFLKTNTEIDTFAISNFHKDYFKAGQWGVIRVGIDKRSKQQLNGKPRLNSGIYAIVKVISEPLETVSNNMKHWTNEEDKVKVRNRVKIQYVKNLLNNPILLSDLQLTESEYDKYLIEGQMASSMPLNPATFTKIISLLDNVESNVYESYPEELEENNIDELTEGKRKLSITYRYERNPLARQLCLQHYGFNCSVCGFNFKDMYGEIGENFIHVHHLNEISLIGTEYKIDPIKDLRPVCANCHSMLHKRNPAFSIEELKSYINNA